MTRIRAELGFSSVDRDGRWEVGYTPCAAMRHNRVGVLKKGVDAAMLAIVSESVEDMGFAVFLIRLPQINKVRNLTGSVFCLATLFH